MTRIYGNARLDDSGRIIRKDGTVLAAGAGGETEFTSTVRVAVSDSATPVATTTAVCKAVKIGDRVQITIPLIVFPSGDYNNCAVFIGNVPSEFAPIGNVVYYGRFTCSQGPTMVASTGFKQSGYGLTTNIFLSNEIGVLQVLPTAVIY